MIWSLRGVFRSVLERVDALDDYFDPHNASPKPFIWTANAQDTLARILRGRDRFERIGLPSEKRLLQVSLDQERTARSYGLPIERQYKFAPFRPPRRTPQIPGGQRDAEHAVGMQFELPSRRIAFRPQRDGVTFELK